MTLLSDLVACRKYSFTQLPTGSQVNLGLTDDVRMRPECIVTTVKFGGGGIMRLGPLSSSEGKVSKAYSDILECP